MFGRRRTTSERPSLLMLRIDRPITRVSSSLVLYRVPRSGFFHFGTVRSFSTTFVQRSGENNDTWWYRTPSFFMKMQGVTPLLSSRTSCAAGNGRFWNIHLTTRCECKVKDQVSYSYNITVLNKGWIKSNGNNLIFLTYSQRYNIYIPSYTLFITFCHMFGRCRTPSACSSLFCIDCPIARISSFLVLCQAPRGGSFTKAKRS